MAESGTGKATPETEHVQGRRKEVVGEVVANRMQKTIVVKVTRKKAHPFYGRVVAVSYTHLVPRGGWHGVQEQGRPAASGCRG